MTTSTDTTGAGVTMAVPDAGSDGSEVFAAAQHAVCDELAALIGRVQAGLPKITGT